MINWVDEQINLRERADNDAFEDSCLRIAGSVMGRKLSAALNDEREQTRDAIGYVMRYYHAKMKEIPDRLKTLDEVLESLLRPHGMMTRTVKLERGWRKDASGAMLTTDKKTGQPIALIPREFYGYKYVDPETGMQKNVTAETEKLFSDEALAFYKPFPLKRLGIRELLRYIIDNLDRGNIVAYLVFCGITTLVGMLVPWINRMLFSDVVYSESVRALIAIAIFMITASISASLFTGAKTLLLNRISVKLDQSVEAATMMRILSLPSPFFREYSSGDLASRAKYMNVIVNQIVDTVMSTSVTAIFSLVYVSQIFHYAPALVTPAIMITLVTLVITIMSIFTSAAVNRAAMETGSKESGLAYALVSGIQKIRLSGAEKRAFAKWGNLYSESSTFTYDPPLFLKINSAINMAVTLFGTIILYSMAIRSHVDVAEYYAFHSAYGLMSGAILSLATVAGSIAQIISTLEMIRPIMDAEPEISEEKPVLDKLTGAIELNNVSFRYREDMPNVLDNVSLKIRSGQYVAITGRTGCGKSTLVRILLGLEEPQKGAVYYDGKDIRSIDRKSLRSRIGTVLQDGKLFSGDLFSNIAICAPGLTYAEAMEAVRMAGMEEDLQTMPMGLFTIISEGSGGISGGQKQRILIARAIAAKPKILLFDEATSALDNITQKKVSDALDALKCTRIVIAHRLSTIRNCDRIIVLDGGHIVEDGSFEELIEKNGFFADLVKRQQVEEA